MAEYPMKLTKDSGLGERGDKVVLPERQAISAYEDKKANYLGGRPEAHDFGESTNNDELGEGYGPTAIKQRAKEQQKERAAGTRKAAERESEKQGAASS